MNAPNAAYRHMSVVQVLSNFDRPFPRQSAEGSCLRMRSLRAARIPRFASCHHPVLHRMQRTCIEGLGFNMNCAPRTNGALGAHAVDGDDQCGNCTGIVAVVGDQRGAAIVRQVEPAGLASGIGHKASQCVFNGLPVELECLRRADGGPGIINLDAKNFRNCYC